MKNLRWIALAALIFPMTAYAASSPFDEAGAKYRAGDFKGASALYQTMVGAGQASAAVHYNLGNTALKMGEKGQALVYYERALMASPRDKDLRWNLQVLRGVLVDKIEDNSHFVLVALRHALEYVGLDEIAILFSVLLGLIALSALVEFAAPAASAAVKPFRALIWVLLAVSALIFAAKIWSVKDQRVVVLDKETYTYYGPSDKETKAFLLHEGAEGKVMDASGDWLYVTLPNKKSGWVRKNSCEII